MRPHRQPFLESTAGSNRWLNNAWRLLALPLLLFFAIPVVVLVLRVPPASLLESLSRRDVLQAVWVSLKTTLISTGLIIAFGTPLAYLMGRYRFRARRFIDTLIDLPTVLPPSVAGILLLITFGRRGVFGPGLEAVGLSVAFTQAAVVMAQVFVAGPFYVRSALLGFSAVDREMLEAAQLDGASRWQSFREVMLPLARFELLSGGVMSWARALGEFGATIIFAGNFPGRTQTMPLAIYMGFEINLENALTLSLILVLLSFVSLLLVKLVLLPQPEPASPVEI